MLSDLYTKTSGGITLAKDVLKTDSTATEAEAKSSYVKYNGLDCRVLYNDDTHGLQIITADSVETYMDNKGIARDARCLGSIPTLTSDSKFQGDTTTEMWSGSYPYLTIYSWNNKFQKGDTNFYVLYLESKSGSIPSYYDYLCRVNSDGSCVGQARRMFV